MGLLKKLFGIGVTAGATVAAVRVSDKYKENNPNGVQDVNGDGKVDSKDVMIEVKKAASEVYNEASAKIKEKTPEYKETFNNTMQQAKDKVNSVVEDIKN